VSSNPFTHRTWLYQGKCTAPLTPTLQRAYNLDTTTGTASSTYFLLYRTPHFSTDFNLKSREMVHTRK
jgi:hypothetical protein